MSCTVDKRYRFVFDNKKIRKQKVFPRPVFIIPPPPGFSDYPAFNPDIVEMICV